MLYLYILISLELENKEYEPNEETKKAILNGKYEEISSINDIWS